MSYRYAELADQLEQGIRSGTYAPGERLPSIRVLRGRTGLSVMTIHRAFRELEVRGLIDVRERSGFFVRPRARAQLPRPATTEVMPRDATLHALTESVVAGTAARDLVPLGGAALSPDLVPVKQLARIAKERLGRDPAALARYSEARGLPILRREIAKWRIAADEAVDPDDVVVTHGAMHAIRLALMAVARRGDLVVVENPTFFGVLQVLRDLGMRALEIPVHADTGIDAAALAGALAEHRPKAMVVTPSHQNPTGAVIPLELRRELLRLAREHETAVIEDDVYGDLHWSGAPLSTLRTLDPDNVIYCTSFSKTLAPGLRMGFCLPGRHLDAITSLKLSGSICSPNLEQLVIGHFLAEGAYERHLRRLRPRIRTQTMRVAEALVRALPSSARVSDPTGGYLLWVELPSGVDSAALYEAALREGIHVLPGVVFSLGDTGRANLRISCGHPWSDRIETAIARLGGLVTDAVEGKQP